MASSEIDTAAKRSRLEVRRNPYWTGISGGRGGVSIGYRTAARGPGSWIAKIVVDGRRVEERLGLADDKGCENGLPYKSAVAEALAWGKRQTEVIAAGHENGSSTKTPTVRSSIEVYVLERKRRALRAGRDAERRLLRHVLSDAKLADMPLTKLRAKSIEAWRERLKIRRNESDLEGLAPATVNRTLNDLRAALNAAAERHRRELPACTILEIKIGTRAMPDASNARKQILTDGEVRRLISAAKEHDDEGDFGRLVLVLAATGARYSQVARIRVGDVQEALGRILVPNAAKGRGTKGGGSVAVPVSSDLFHELRPVTEGRAPGDVLLMHWHVKQIGPGVWVKDKRAFWGQNEMTRPWTRIREAAGVGPEVVAYGLRHASIVRGLKAGLPLRLVAALHNTSSAMIEKHYGAFILDMAEDLARRATLSLSA